MPARHPPAWLRSSPTSWAWGKLGRRGYVNEDTKEGKRERKEGPHPAALGLPKAQLGPKLDPKVGAGG